MFFRADIALSLLLDVIISVPGFWSVASLACLLSTHRDGYIRDNQDDIDKAIIAQTNAWTFNGQSVLKERARWAIENPLKQPEQDIQYQAREDDWMISECLCAIYNTSSESPGE